MAKALWAIIQSQCQFHGPNITAVSADLANGPLAHAIYGAITDAHLGD